MRLLHEQTQKKRTMQQQQQQQHQKKKKQQKQQKQNQCWPHDEQNEKNLASACCPTRARDACKLAPSRPPSARDSELKQKRVRKKKKKKNKKQKKKKKKLKLLYVLYPDTSCLDTSCWPFFHIRRTRTSKLVAHVSSSQTQLHQQHNTKTNGKKKALHSVKKINKNEQLARAAWFSALLVFTLRPFFTFCSF